MKQVKQKEGRMTGIFTLTLLLAISSYAGTVRAVQTCRSESEIPANTPTEQFIDHGDGTVTDTKTGLMWAKCPEGLSGSDCATGSAITHNWQEALNLASTSVFADYNDWRLPNINELLSIIERQCANPAINLLVFPNTPASFFWTASPYYYLGNIASGHDFKYGDEYGHGKIDANRVRFVRGGE